MPHFITILFLCGILFAFYSIGFGFNFLIKIAQKEDTPYFTIFSNFILGLVISVSLTACFFTSLVTTSALFLVLFGYVIFFNRNKNANTNFYFYKLYILPFFILISYSLSVFKGYNLEGEYTQGLFLDYLFYKQIVVNLIHGQENISEWANILDKDYNGIVPYHYFELWLTVLTSKINKLPILLNFVVYIPTLLITTILFGILSILESNRTITLKHILVVVVLLFAGQVYLPFYERFFWSGYQHVFTSVGYVPLSEKIFPFALFGIAAFSALLHQKYYLFLVYLLFLSIASFTATPAVFASLYVLLVANLYFKFIADKRIYFLALFPLLYALFLFLFKQSSTYVFIETTSLVNSVSLLDGFSIKNSIVYFILRPSYFLFPTYIIIGLLLLKKKIILDQQTIFIGIFFIGLIGGSSLMSLFYSYDANSVQLINLPLYGFGFAILIVAISRLDKKMYVSFVFLGILISINFYYNFDFFYKKLNENKIHSQDYILALQKELTSDQLIPLAAFCNLDVTFNFVMFDGLGKEVLYLDNVGLIRMTNATMPESENIKYLSVNVFYKFVKENGYSLETNLAEAQLAFFKKYQIKYLLIQKGEKIPAKLEEKVIKSYVDALSGNRFCIIKL